MGEQTDVHGDLAKRLGKLEELWPRLSLSRIADLEERVAALSQKSETPNREAGAGGAGPAEPSESLSGSDESAADLQELIERAEEVLSYHGIEYLEKYSYNAAMKELDTCVILTREKYKGLGPVAPEKQNVGFESSESAGAGPENINSNPTPRTSKDLEDGAGLSDLKLFDDWCGFRVVVDPEAPPYDPLFVADAPQKAIYKELEKRHNSNLKEAYERGREYGDCADNLREAHHQARVKEAEARGYERGKEEGEAAQSEWKRVESYATGHEHGRADGRAEEMQTRNKLLADLEKLANSLRHLAETYRENGTPTDNAKASECDDLVISLCLLISKHRQEADNA